MEEIVSGALYLVSTPIGNLADITYRAVHILNGVNLIAAEDTRKSGILLKNYGIKTPTTSYHSYNLERTTPKLVEKLLHGNSIALISDAGTPGISDPAYQLVRSCIENQIRIIPIPGASAILGALVASGLSTNKFVYEGFLPVKKGRKTRFESLKNESRTLIIYESPHRIKKTVGELLHYFGDRNCVLAREITKKFEEFYRGRLSELSEHLEASKVKGELVLLIEGQSEKKGSKNEREE
ncbi:MAG: 16S rRNA (cytidine(1402)-2'-O)-methyltransferase [Calditrichaceae bacterium]